MKLIVRHRDWQKKTTKKTGKKRRLNANVRMASKPPVEWCVLLYLILWLSCYHHCFNFIALLQAQSTSGKTCRQAAPKGCLRAARAVRRGETERGQGEPQAPGQRSEGGLSHIVFTAGGRSTLLISSRTSLLILPFSFFPSHLLTLPFSHFHIRVEEELLRQLVFGTAGHSEIQE